VSATFLVVLVNKLKEEVATIRRVLIVSGRKASCILLGSLAT